MDRFVSVILPILPACACFGPMLIALGVVFRTPVRGPVRPKRSAACLVGGTLMITLTLFALVLRTI